MRKIAACSVLLGLLCVSFGGAGLVKPRKPEVEEKIGPGVTRSYVEAFKKNEPARAIVSGSYQTCLRTYVFDSQGNCVAWDDFSSPKTADDLVVVWHPTEEAAYSIDVLNAGFDVNVYQIALR